MQICIETESVIIFKSWARARVNCQVYGLPSIYGRNAIKKRDFLRFCEKRQDFHRELRVHCKSGWSNRDSTLVQVRFSSRNINLL